MSETKTPWYKTWWVWVIAGTIVIIIIASSGGNKDDKTSSLESDIPSAIQAEISAAAQGTACATEAMIQPSVNPEVTPTPGSTASVKTYSDGMYKVGAEIPAGEYIMFTDSFGYYEVAKDSSGELESIICNDNFNTFTILTVEEGNYLEIDRAEVCLLSDYIGQAGGDIMGKTGRNGDGTYEGGMYKIGVMLPAGEYKLTSAEDMAYAAVYKDSKCIGVESIITNDNFSGSKYITVKDGQYLLVDRAVIAASD